MMHNSLYIDTIGWLSSCIKICMHQLSSSENLKQGKEFKIVKLKKLKFWYEVPNSSGCPTQIC